MSSVKTFGFQTHNHIIVYSITIPICHISVYVMSLWAALPGNCVSCQHMQMWLFNNSRTAASHQWLSMCQWEWDLPCDSADYFNDWAATGKYPAVPDNTHLPHLTLWRGSKKSYSSIHYLSLLPPIQGHGVLLKPIPTVFGWKVGEGWGGGTGKVSKKSESQVK